ncbi:hypothetical protein X777_03315 [Ooceraea biroi]|uniref:FAM234A/B beta-propeller domain-containing protein n=1 Tax=Ooceraea biroi TaxID=2015173 RepID=A0A026WKM0_OOCBI|nr:hypothetical protein X777_03315 [Ooceraea biroi]
MSAVYPTLPKLAVRDSIDDDDLTDIDDEVFIRDGRNGLKLDDDGGVKRPLMAPRRKCKKSCSFQTHKFPYRALLVPLCYGIAALAVVLGLIVLCIFTVNIFPMPLTILKNWLSHELKDSVNKSLEVVPCTSLASKVLWTRTLPKLTSEAPLRSNDVNSDGVEDIIVGFSTGLDTMDAPEYICTIYFGSQTPCLGGVLALNGKTGDTIWTHWTAHAVFSVDCNEDLTNDRIKDCVISGRGGILQAVYGHNGSSIWEIPIQNPTSEQRRLLDVYDARFMPDVDGDGVSDVIAAYAVQSNDVRESKVLVISGQHGDVIRSVSLPYSEQLFIAPQIMVHPDGENIFILATSSQQEAGGLYIVSQANIFYGDLQLRKLYHNTGKGALLPPILLDITSDGIEDIVAAMFNSTIVAYDGSTFEPIWNYTVPNSEIISIPVPGYYNDDDVPDFLVKYQIGAGFPTYYYTVATVVDGRNGQPLLERPMEDSSSRQMSGLSVTVDGFGNDWFLHWSADCLNYEGVKEKYQFLKGQSLVSQTRADLCRLRFNSTLTTRLLALSQHVGPPGVSLYFSEDWRAVEFNNSIDPRKEAEKYLDAHPRFEIVDTYADMPLVSERSPRVQKNHRTDSVFKHKGNNILADVGKYDSDAVYDNFDEFKSHKKSHNPEDDAVDVVDPAWKHDNKWASDNVQSEKEYDGLYGSEDGNTEDGEQNDYAQAEARERRSAGEARASYPTGSSRGDAQTSKTVGHSFFTSSEPTRRNLQPNKNITIANGWREIDENGTVSTADTNVSAASTLKFPGEITPTLSSEWNMEKNTTMQSTSDASERTEVLGVTENQIINGRQDTVTSADEPVGVTQRRQMYKHSFPNIVQDAEDDASIEKVFKRESLKNQDKGRISKKKQTLMSSSTIEKNSRTRQKRRIKRKSETGGRSSDISGIQTQPPTGILLPSIAESKDKTAIDLVFSTFWLPSSEVSLVLSQTDLECIQRKKAASENKARYKKDDDIISECLSERGVNYRLYQESMDRENTKIALGQMTIYRMKLECVCPEDMLPNQTCRNIALQQSWPEHLGSSGNGYFKPLHRLNI